MLYENVEHVTQLINGYNEIVGKLSPPELQFLREHLYSVEAKIQAGLGRYTWQSLNIKEYTDKCLPHLKTLRSMVAQIGFTGDDIRHKMHELEQFSLFVLGTAHDQKPKKSTLTYTLREPSSSARGAGDTKTDAAPNDTKRESKVSFAADVDDAGLAGKCLPCRQFFEALDIDRNVKVSRMKKIYDSIGPTLIKLESLILGTYTGDTEKMQQYYVYWEREIFRLLLRWEIDLVFNFILTIIFSFILILRQSSE